MVNLKVLTVSVLMLVGADAYEWTKCKNAPNCLAPKSIKRNVNELEDLTLKHLKLNEKLNENLIKIDKSSLNARAARVGAGFGRGPGKGETPEIKGKNRDKGNDVGGGIGEAADFAATIYGLFGTSSKGDSTRFHYEQKDSYWYSHDVNGLFVSPTGFTRFKSGYNYLRVNDKNGGTTWWTSHGSDCCLPDGVGDIIQDVKAFN